MRIVVSFDVTAGSSALLQRRSMHKGANKDVQLAAPKECSTEFTVVIMNATTLAQILAVYCSTGTRS
jgi:hypothetical protein